MSDVMLLGILRMPVGFENLDVLTFHQMQGRMIEAANRIESDAKELAALRAENERLKADKRELVDALKEMIGCATSSSCTRCEMNCKPGDGPITKARAAVAKHSVK